MTNQDRMIKRTKRQLSTASTKLHNALFSEKEKERKEMFQTGGPPNKKLLENIGQVGIRKAKLFTDEEFEYNLTVFQQKAKELEKDLAYQNVRHDTDDLEAKNLMRKHTRKSCSVNRTRQNNNSFYVSKHAMRRLARGQDGLQAGKLNVLEKEAYKEAV